MTMHPAKVTVLLLAAVAVPTFAADTPTTQPAAQITAAAQSELAPLATAYKNLKSLDLAGTISGDFDAAGQKRNFSDAFTSSYTKDAGFRHEMKDDLLLGSTGTKVYAYMPKRKLYTQTDAAADHKLPDSIAGSLRSQNPSLALALAKDPAAELAAHATRIDRGPDLTVEGAAKPLPTLQITGPDLVPTTLAIDPATHLLRRAQFDLSDNLKKRGATAVNKATITIDYTQTDPNPAAAKPDQYAWTPPDGARDLATANAADDGGAPGSAAQALVGQPAPDLSLTNLDGSAFSLAKQKGSVVVLDFWATWCGPCVASMPHLDQLYKDKKDAGLKLFAVNQGEDTPTVKKFIDAKKYSFPVLLDPDGKAGEKYKVEAIPETVIVGKDGIIKKVIIGLDPDAVNKAVEDAMGK